MARRGVRGGAALIVVCASLTSGAFAASPSPSASPAPSVAPSEKAATVKSHGKVKKPVDTWAVQAAGLVESGKYQDAKRAARARLADDPNDGDAYQALGAADEALHDHYGATNAFDRAGTVDPGYRRIAARAYAAVATSALNAHHTARALSYANRSLELDTTVETLYLRATAWASVLRYAPAIADYEAAKALAKQSGTSRSMMDAIDAGLATAYIFGGDPDKGAALAAEYKARNPGSTRTDDAIVDFYTQASVAALRQGKPEDSINGLERAAVLVPAQSLPLFLRAANVMMSLTPVDWKRVKAEADKALALAPNDAHVNYLEALALNKSGDANDAIPFLQTAKANVSGDPILAGQIDEALRALTGH